MVCTVRHRNGRRTAECVGDRRTLWCGLVTSVAGLCALCEPAHAGHVQRAVVWRAGGTKDSQTGLVSYTVVPPKAGQSWRVLIKSDFIRRDVERFRLRIRAGDDTVIDQFAIAEQAPRDPRNVLADTWTPITFNGGNASVPLLGGKSAVSDAVSFPLRKDKSYSLTFYANRDAQCVYQPAPGVINSYVIHGDYRGARQWSGAVEQGKGKAFRGIGYDLEICDPSVPVPAWQAGTRVVLPQHKRLEPAGIPTGRVPYDLQRFRAQRQNRATGAEPLAIRQRRVRNKIPRYQSMCDPRLYDPGFKVPPGKPYAVGPTPKGYREWARYAGILLDSDDPAHIRRAGRILRAMSTRPDWVKGRLLQSHYSLLPILRVYPAQRHRLDEPARTSYEARLRQLFQQRPTGAYNASADDASVVRNSSSRIYRDASTCSIVGQMLGLPKTLAYGLGAVARIRRVANANPICMYNDQMYGPFHIESMAQVVQYVDHWPSVISALLLEERAFMTQALMFHRPTTEHTGPEVGRPARTTMGFLGTVYPPARKKWGAVLSVGLNLDFPDYLSALADQEVNPFTARFTVTSKALRHAEVVVHRTREFAMASQSEPEAFAAPQRYNHTAEAQPVMLYRRENAPAGRIVIRATEQTQAGLVANFGQLFALQHRSKLVGFYAYHYPHWTIKGKKYLPRAAVRLVATSLFVPASMRLVVARPDGKADAHGHKAFRSGPVDPHKPTEVQPGDIILGQDARTYVAVIPLESGDLVGRSAQAPRRRHACILPKRRVRTPDWWAGPEQPSYEILITAYEATRDGECRTFSPEQLRKDNRCAFAIEMGDQDAYAGFDVFRTHIQSTRVTDSGHRGLGQRTVEYRSGNDALRLAYQPDRNRITQRQVNGHEPRNTHVECPLANWSDTGTVVTGRARLTTRPGVPVYLFSTGRGTHAVWKLGARPATLRLGVPEGWIEAREFPIGKLVYRPGAKPVLRVFSSDSAEIRLKAGTPSEPVFEWNARAIRARPGSRPGESILRPQ